MNLREKLVPPLLMVSLLLTPINLFLKWGETQAYVGGIFSDYLVQKLWLGEIPLFLGLIIWLSGKIIDHQQKISYFLKKNWILFIGLIIFLARQFVTPLPEISYAYLFRILEFSTLAWYLFETSDKLNLLLLRGILLIGLLFQALIASMQFIKQTSLFAYQVLGETQLTQAVNVARTNFSLGEVILPYGTTAHPNILAGVALIFGLLWLQLKPTPKKYNGLDLLVVGLISWLIFLTQSYSAMAALVIFSFTQILPTAKTVLKKLAPWLIIGIPVVLFLLSPAEASFSRRNFLNSRAITVFTKQPVFGAGLGMFTTTLGSGFFPDSELIRFVQPTHNVFLLLLAETGLLGLMLALIIFKKLKITLSADWLVLLIILLSLDHYLLTQWVGGVLLALIIGLTAQRSANSSVK